MTYLYSHCKVCAWIVALAMIAAVAVPGTSLGAVFTNDTFESTDRGAVPVSGMWGITDSSVIVTNNGAATSWGSDPIDGNYSNVVYVPQDQSLTNETSGASLTNVWVDMYIQPNLYDSTWSNREVDATAAALFFFDEASSNVVVHDGSSVTNWQKLATSVGGTSVQVSESGQTRVTVYMDYPNDTWSLFLDGRLMKDGIGFVSAKSSMGGLVISDNVYLDNVWINATNYPTATAAGSQPELMTDENEPSDEDRDGMGDAWEILNFGAIDVSEGGASENQDGDSRSDLEEYVDGTDPNLATDVAWLIPYYEKFVTAGDVGTEMSSTLRAISHVASNVTVSGGSTYSLQAMSDNKAIALADGGAMSVVVSNQFGTNVFCQVYVRPTPCEIAPSGVVDDEAAAICVIGNELFVYSSNDWVSAGVTDNALTNGWVGLAAHLDYNAKTWDLYYSIDGDLSMQMEAVPNGPFDFNTNSTSTTFTEMTIENESSVTSYVDAVAVSLTDKAVDGSYTNLVIFERLANTINETAVPPYDYSADGTLESGAIGTDFSFGLAAGDVIQAYTGGVWLAYELAGNGSWSHVEGPEDQDWSVIPGIEIVREPGYDSLAFYPFGDSPGNTETQMVYASTDNDFHGRSRLRVPSSRLTCIDVNDLTFNPNPAEDDELIFYVPATESQLIFTWDSGTSKWVNDNVSTHEVCPGDGFSYFRRTGTSLEFIIAQ